MRGALSTFSRISAFTDSWPRNHIHDALLCDEIGVSDWFVAYLCIDINASFLK